MSVKRHTQETKDRISAKLKGIPQPPEKRKAISETLKFNEANGISSSSPQKSKARSIEIAALKQRLIDQTKL